MLASLLLVAPVALSLGHNLLGVGPPIRGERLSDGHLVLSELAVLAASRVPFFVPLGLDDFTFYGHGWFTPAMTGSFFVRSGRETGCNPGAKRSGRD